MTSNNEPGRNAADQMAEHGITCVPIDNFYYREFHYTNVKDAIAQATRDKIRLKLLSTE